ncbi:hypothetical protein M9H77_24612 [Catharanthus roseus]|uniref:Uncharacterized protein n=1 Tax=Catharanthus roseus TaxID=4058 RepID=A0ACC0AWN4_CATRO|nr:hypothetical protein M9H77_24612 [Catharanthus roseus]
MSRFRLAVVGTADCTARRESNYKAASEQAESLIIIRDGTDTHHKIANQCREKRSCKYCNWGFELYKMSYVIVLSLPLILLFLITALACYLVGRARGRHESSSAITIPQYYGPPAPAPPIGAQTPLDK